MRPEALEECRESIRREIASWGEPAWPVDDPWRAGVERIPAYLDALAALAVRPELSDHQRRVVNRVMKYLVSPLDLLPEFIYGPTGFREDLALVAMAAARLEAEVGRDVVGGCGLSTEDEALRTALDRAEADLDDDVRYHLALLLEADSVAGDEAPPGAEAGAEPASPPAAGEHTIVFAGPGTGKTYRLECELERLLVQEGVPPGQVLATTFTNKAADELRVRVRRRLEQSGATLDVDQTLQGLTISTIHAFCFKLIGDFHHHALFLKGAHVPMDETQRMLFLFRHGIGALKLKAIYPDWKVVQQQADGWRPVDLFHFYAYAGGIYDFLSEDVMRGAEPELRTRYLQLVQGDEAAGVDERIIQTYPRYWRLVQAEGYLDHSMTLAYAEALLDDPHVRARVQARYRHVLVDEYQDTNPIQDRIFRLLTGNGSGRLFAVGDDDQSIYAFRGADVRNATEFTGRWPGAQVELLNENRRSTKELVDAAQALIAHNKTRQPKHLYTQNPKGVLPWRLEAPWGALPSRVADWLQALKDAGCIHQWNEAAILFRGLSGRVAEYRKALDALAIPSVLAGDRRFLKRPVVRGLLKVFEMIAGEADKITNRKRAHRPFFEELGWSDRAAMLEKVREWHEAAHEGRFESLLELYYTILADTGALEAESLLSEFGHLSAFIAGAEEQLTSPDLLKRLKYFLRYADAATGSFAGPEPEIADAVQIMTMHKAKGLEFPAVVVADAGDGVLPAHFPEDVRTRLRRELAGLASGLNVWEEERRVLYVALTRAERYAVLATDPATPSPFLRELPTEAAPRTLRPLPGSPAVQTERRAPPLHLSHGEVFNYHFCPKRYALENGYGFAGQAIAPMRTGQSLHRALEIYHRLKAEREHVTRDRRERIFERAWIRPRDTKKSQKEYERLFAVFDRYADRWESEEPRVRVRQTEQPFFAAEGGGVLTGRIDLVRERDGALEIVEVKFHPNPMMPDYPTRQLHHYELAYPREELRLLVHYLADDREEEIAPQDPELVRQELAETFANVRQGRFQPTPKPSRCRLCPVRFVCTSRVED